ncbi:hypothetical protein [Sphingosinithalassobacter sp. LHW66-3]|uniref:hypothetical protein n=1 Tax=Sphingosinithalassobacter sp. LHW66-3 TaxID=3424718 RepID=UPI003D6B95CA
MVDNTTPGATSGGAPNATPGTGATMTTEAPMKTTGTASDAAGGNEGGSSSASGSGTRDKIREEASKLGSQAAERARGYAGQGKERATGALDELSRMMGDAAGDVDERLGPQYGKYARSAASSVQSFADTLRSREVDDLLQDASEFVRKSPAIAIGTAAVLGFAFARLIKSGVEASSDATDTTANG